MKPAIYRISLDILESQSQYSLPMKEGETSREIHITLREGVVPYEIGKDCFAVFSGRKPDGNPLENNCVIKENTIIYAITEQTTSVSGLVDCEIKLYGANNGFICSARFSIIVDPRAVEDKKVESTSEFLALTELYSNVVTSENARVEAELKRENNTAAAIENAEEATDRANNIADTLQDKLNKGEFKGEKGEKGDKGDTPAIDQSYNPTSENAQSGVAVSEAFKGILSTYESNNILNLDDYTSGYIANDGNGNPASSSALKYSTPIPVVEGDVIRSYRYDSSTGTLSPYGMTFVAAYQNGVIKPYHGAKNVGIYTVLPNVDSIIITINPTVVHEITKNYEATEYEEYFPKRTEVKQEALPVASETAFGVCKIWSTENESGEKVLNIITGESYE